MRSSLTRGEMYDEYVHRQYLGSDAGQAGTPPTVCPYGRDDILRTAWIKGYVSPDADARGPNPSSRTWSFA